MNDAELPAEVWAISHQFLNENGEWENVTDEGPILKELRRMAEEGEQ